MNTATKDKPAFVCQNARRHMLPREYVVYDFVLALAKSGQKERKKKGEDPGELICYAELLTMANATGISLRTVKRAVPGLVKAGWLIPLLGCESQQLRFHRGRWASNRYRVVEHVEFAEKHGCPPNKYDPETGENLQKRPPRPGITEEQRKAWIETLPEFIRQRELGILRGQR